MEESQTYHISYLPLSSRFQESQQTSTEASQFLWYITSTDKG